MHRYININDEFFSLECQVFFMIYNVPLSNVDRFQDSLHGHVRYNMSFF